MLTSTITDSFVSVQGMMGDPGLPGEQGDNGDPGLPGLPVRNMYVCS